MGLSPNAVRNTKNRRITEYEIAVAKVKLMGLTVMGLICSVVLVVSPP